MTHARTHVHTHMVQIIISLRRAGREIISFCRHLHREGEKDVLHMAESHPHPYEGSKPLLIQGTHDRSQEAHGTVVMRT